MKTKMVVEKEVLLSMLRCTRAGPVSRQHLAKVSKVSMQDLETALANFSRAALFKEYGSIIEASSDQRVRMVVFALQLGADFLRVCNLLSWNEFEGVAAQALESNGYRVTRNFHFKREGKKREIDVLGIKKPLILSVDCKHWRHGWRNTTNSKAVKAQIARTLALADALPHHTQKLNLDGWHRATLVPLILSLFPGPSKFYDRVAVVPVLQLQDFINEVPLVLGSLLHIDRECEGAPSKLTDFLKK